MQMRPRQLAPLLAILCGAACASYSGVRFAPTVQDAELRGEANDLQARIVVAWRGIEERDERPELRFRVRVENPGTTPFTLVPAEFELLDGALVPFGPARTDDVPVSVEPGRSASFDLAFAVPDGDVRDRDLTALNLHVRFQAGRWSWSTTFQRAEHAHYHDPYWSSPWHFSFGVMWYD